MSEKNHLYLLWTNADKLTAEKMVFMYTVNSLIHGWWEYVTLIVWGATAKLAAEDQEIRAMIRDALEKGVHVTACKACTDQLGVTAEVEALGVEVKYWGAPLTEILKSNEKLLTV
ncbi:MAG TPA: DsrE family protein [Desulfobacteraceae bacterium]|nr:DsrE family protein [Desulfobacteraceae bacterium]|tara:strand:+ start:648 stop:992 length:345 start_codon:yes stop_codon:yes gene_type:complete